MGLLQCTQPPLSSESCLPRYSAADTACSTGRLLCHWDPTWTWAQLQLVAACHGPGNTILILTAARVVFLVAHNGDKLQRGNTPSSPEAGGSRGGVSSQELQFQQQQVLEKYSVKVSAWFCREMKAWRADSKSRGRFCSGTVCACLVSLLLSGGHKL